MREGGTLGLACLYGVVGSFYNKIGNFAESKEYFEKSKECFENAKRINKNNPANYKNSAITSMYLKDIENMEDDLKKAFYCMQVDDFYILEDKNVLSVFKKDDIEFAKQFLGENKWKELEKEFSL